LLCERRSRDRAANPIRSSGLERVIRRIWRG
jgi:hypothetical protein